MLDKTILAYALRDKKFTMDLVNSVTVEYFKTDFQPLFKAVQEHFTNPKFKEIPTENIFKEHLEKNYAQPEFHNKMMNLYAEIKATEVNAPEFTWYLEKLKARYNDQLQRSCTSRVVQLIKAENDTEKRVEEVNKIMRETVVNIDSIYKQQAYKEGSLDESAKERFERYKQIEENPDLARGILTGFVEFDRITAGLHPGEVMIVAGATGTGKSVVMHNIGVNAYLNGNDPLLPAENATNKGYNILYFSLEMPKETIERRVDACMGGLYYNEIRDGALTEEDKKKYFNLLKFQMKYPHYFHVVDMAKGATTREIELKYLELCESKFKPDLVIIDYLGIMSPNEPGDSDWLALGKTAAELHEFARTYEIPVITGSQVNRPPKEGKVKHSTDRIARSDTITHNVNIIIQIGCREDERTRMDMPVYITKMRDGETGAFVLSKDFKRMKVVDATTETFGEDDDDLDEI